MVNNRPTSGSEKPSTQKKIGILAMTKDIERKTMYYDRELNPMRARISNGKLISNNQVIPSQNFIRIPKTTPSTISKFLEYLLKDPIPDLYTRLKKLSKLTSLHTYFGTDKLQNRFLHTLFFGLLAKESAFGQLTTVKREKKDKGVFQITPIAIDDAPRTKDKNVYKNIWSLSTRDPELSDRNNLKLATELSIITFQRIYEICKTPLNDPYFIKNKQSLVIPLLMLGYNLGGGDLKKLLQAILENKSKFDSNETKLRNALKLGLEKGIIDGPHVHYLTMILKYRNELQPHLPTVLKRNQEQVAARQASKAARRELAQSISTNLQPTLPVNLQPTPESQAQSKREAQQAMVNDLLSSYGIEDITTSLPKALRALDNQATSSGHPEKRPNPRLQAKRPRMKKFSEIISAKPTHDQIVEWIIGTYKPKESTQMLHGQLQLIQEYPYKIKVTSDLPKTKYRSVATIIAAPMQLLDNFLETPVNKYASWEKLPSHKRPNFLPPYTRY